MFAEFTKLIRFKRISAFVADKFSCVYFLMGIQMGTTKKGFITNVAFKEARICVSPFVYI